MAYLERACREFADADWTGGCYDMAQMAELVAMAAKIGEGFEAPQEDE
ncbi:MAG: hypothetical protein ACYTBJ_02480 [Planctomycetota bacterium]